MKKQTYIAGIKDEGKNYFEDFWRSCDKRVSTVHRKMVNGFAQSDGANLFYKMFEQFPSGSLVIVSTPDGYHEADEVLRISMKDFKEEVDALIAKRNLYASCIKHS